MLTVSDLTISRGAQELLRQVTFSVPAGRRAALIGANGSGKSTLLETIQGRHPQRAGSISWTPADLTVGYLDQSGNSSAAGSVGSSVPPPAWSNRWRLLPRGWRRLLTTRKRRPPTAWPWSD